MAQNLYTKRQEMDTASLSIRVSNKTEYLLVNSVSRYARLDLELIWG